MANKSSKKLKEEKQEAKIPLLSKEALSKSGRRLLIESLLAALDRHGCLDEKELPKIISSLAEPPGQGIPLSIFTGDKLSPLESISLYMRDELGLPIGQIARRLSRSEPTIRASYRKAKLKQSASLKISSSSKLAKQKTQAHEGAALTIPIRLLSDSTLTPLQSAVIHMREFYRMDNPKIASLLNRSPKSISALYIKAKESSSG